MSLRGGKTKTNQTSASKKDLWLEWIQTEDQSSLIVEKSSWFSASLIGTFVNDFIWSN